MFSFSHVCRARTSMQLVSFSESAITFAGSYHTADGTFIVSCLISSHWWTQRRSSMQLRLLLLQQIYSTQNYCCCKKKVAESARARPVCTSECDCRIWKWTAQIVPWTAPDLCLPLSRSNKRGKILISIVYTCLEDDKVACTPKVLTADSIELLACPCRQSYVDCSRKKNVYRQRSRRLQFSSQSLANSYTQAVALSKTY